MEDTINGVIAIDGWEWNVGFVQTPIKLKMEKGRIVEITGGREAKTFAAWISGFKDPNMYR